MLLQRRRARAGARARHAAEHTVNWADGRLPVSEGGGLLRKAFPEHWSFLLGEIALYSFVVLLLTGVWLTLFFKPSMTEVVYDGSYEPLLGVSMSEAYRSTLDISFDVRGGLLIRQAHHWASLVFLSAIGVHLLRVFFTGAFRRPREVNWLIGLTLFVLALAEGFAGYSLPDDLLSGTGLRIAQGIMLSIPVVGTYISMFVFGGEYPGHDIVPRLYSLHILLVPALLVALVTLHLILVFYLKHTQWAGRGRTNRNAVGKPMFPQFMTNSTGLFLMVFGVLVVLAAVAEINPIWTYGPYRPDIVSTGSQPDWYVGFLEGSLRLMPPFETAVAGHTVMWNVLVPAVLLPGALFAVLYAYPFFERWVTGDHEEHHLCDRPRDKPVRTGLGVAAIVFYAVLLLAGGNDILAHTFHVSLNLLTWIFRVSLVLAPPLAFVVTKRVCLALQEHDRERLTEGEETGEVHQTLAGGYAESHGPLDPEERHVLRARRQPAPLAPSPKEGDAPHVGRLRATLSEWYYGDRVDVEDVEPEPEPERESVAQTEASAEAVERDAYSGEPER
ncbi:cytochrome bc1 complex cytochrome b subunit [Streptomyces lividans]|uniref:Cytochrome bc1 complex cytochrome b subunit n=3 Tax=Streptomyces TaxID=1883 RepID=A0A7U9DXV4_STRLI|nr:MULTISPECIES: ubiquinol-cytochrome c reductase cytochrome b subunit [Streptomyces]QSJ07152.1 Ubiquinol-cytochrome c reductase cytochrome b subunit [Streptomyces lividans]WOY96454.1 ubiquinol-cytochrome c reductase cytochrome b subunit [Streptomyces violaceoruber]BDD76618.1 menaquinol-cytochrome c reductase cytochrome b subunit [Streptomyces coelicolor]AIJ11649.1 Ubiquinol-cytochrome c reductase cytochrome b subunit [Streptomyces lividans TK24]EOY52156.1 Ubiquinol--cytochrome c reductase, cy